MKNPEKTKSLIIADWRTGAYSQRQLAEKYSVSNGFVAKYTKGVEQDTRAVVSAGVAYRQGLAEIDEQAVSSVSKVVEEKTKDLMIANTLKRNVMIKANKLVVAAEDAKELKDAADAGYKYVELTIGKNPETAIQINHTEQPTIIRLLGPND